MRPEIPLMLITFSNIAEIGERTTPESIDIARLGNAGPSETALKLVSVVFALVAVGVCQWQSYV